jgi:hypothetical protein
MGFRRRGGKLGETGKLPLHGSFWSGLSARPNGKLPAEKRSEHYYSDE